MSDCGRKARRQWLRIECNFVTETKPTPDHVENLGTSRENGRENCYPWHRVPETPLLCWECWHLTQDAAEIRKVIPTGSQDMIRLQIKQFSDLDRKILQCAALQGVEFDSEVIARCLSIDPGEVEERLQGLERIHRFVQWIGERRLLDRSFSIRYRFAHVLYQNALYADLARVGRPTVSVWHRHW